MRYLILQSDVVCERPPQGNPEDQTRGSFADAKLKEDGGMVHEIRPEYNPQKKIVRLLPEVLCI